VGQWLTALLEVVVMLQHYPRFVPFPEGAPGHSADFAGDPEQLQCPRRMGLVDNISRNRRFANGYRHTSDLGHCMKRKLEAEKKCAHSRLSANRLLRGFAASLDIVGIVLVEDVQIFFVATADLSMDDG